MSMVQRGVRAGATQEREVAVGVRGWLRRRRAVRVTLSVAALLLLASFPLSYWSLRLEAPQYPGGLPFTMHVTRLGGNVQEIDELNHYIGMKKLEDVATLERRLWPAGLVAVALLALVPAVVDGRWTWIFALGPLLYPVGFVVDLYWRLYTTGHSLDPHAALSSSVHAFTPRLLGSGMIAQFRTEAAFGPGYYFALVAAALVAVAFWLDSRSFARGRRA